MSSGAKETGLDLRGVAPAEQVRRTQEACAGQRAVGGTVRVLLDREPARLYVSLLENGYRCVLRRENGGWSLVVQADSVVLGQPRGAHSIQLDPSSGRLYVTTLEDCIAVLDASRRTFERAVCVGRGPSHLTLSADGRWLYVANAASHDLAIVDTAAGEVAASVAVGSTPLLP